MMEVLKNISEVWAYNLRQYRGNRTQSDIAELAGLSLRAYQRMESGSLPKSPQSRAGVAKALGVSENKLFLDPDLAGRPILVNETVQVQAAVNALTNYIELRANVPEDILEALPHASPTAVQAIRSILIGSAIGREEKLEKSKKPKNAQEA